jgi:hypothetical protein
MSSLSISAFTKVFQKNPDISLTKIPEKEMTEIIEKLKNINSSYFFRSDSELIKKLENANSIDLRKILMVFFNEMIEKGEISNPIKFLDRLADIIPLKKIQDLNEILNEANNKFQEAKIFLQKTNNNSTISIKNTLLSIFDGIIQIIESIINAFGMGDFFKPADNSMRAEFNSNKIFMLLSIFTTTTALIVPSLGAELASYIIGGTLLCIAALGIIWPFIKPKPSHLPYAENWTREVQKKGFEIEANKRSLDEIANILKMNRHAILVGKSRVGKSLTAKAFAQAIERGDYPELKGKIVFRINTTDIVDQKASFLGGGNESLTEISRAMGRHRKDIILVLDEIQSACKKDVKIADQLKTFLDEGGDFSHVIGITTDIEYEQDIKNNHAFSLRFDKVNIENSNKDETLKILSNSLLTSSSKPIITENALDIIYAKACKIKDSPQPNSSLRLLKKCINLTEKSQYSSTQRKIIEISNKILSLHSQAAASRGRKKDVSEEMLQLEEKMNELKKTLGNEKNELEKLFKAKSLFDLETKQAYSTILKINSLDQNNLNYKNEKQLKLYLLLHKFLSQSLESYIMKKSKELGVKIIIDEALINEAINS